MAERFDVLWLSSELQSAEYCIVAPGLYGATVESTTLLPYRDLPARIDYSISTSPAWVTQQVRIELAAGDLRRTVGLVQNEGWLVDGTPRPDLDGCVDVDLGWTPATNLLPLRRVPLEDGQSMTTIAAWVRFPELDIVPSHQTYTRLARDRVLYQSATFEAELVVTPDGIVTTYGAGLWSAAKLHQRR